MILHHFIVEHREVQGQSQLDRVAGWEGDPISFLVGLKGFTLDFLELGALGGLSNVSVIVTYHLDKEGLGFVPRRLGEDFGLDEVDDGLTVPVEALLDLLFVVCEGAAKLGVFGVLLNSRDGSPGGPLAGDQILEGHAQEVPLIRGHVATLGVEH